MKQILKKKKLKAPTQNDLDSTFYGPQPRTDPIRFSLDRTETFWAVLSNDF